MLERDMRQILVRMLKPLHAVSVENGGCHPGTPDINFAGGWMECKATNCWPARPSTPVVLDHPLTPQQKIFLRKRASAGEKAYVMVNVDGEWLLFDGLIASEFLGTLDREDLYAVADRVWTKTPPADELLQVIREARS